MELFEGVAPSGAATLGGPDAIASVADVTAAPAAAAASALRSCGAIPEEDQISDTSTVLDAEAEDVAGMLCYESELAEDVAA